MYISTKYTTVTDAESISFHGKKAMIYRENNINKKFDVKDICEIHDFECKQSNKGSYTINQKENICTVLGLNGDCPQNYDECPHETDEIMDCMK
ncbi:MAG: hypothetical protein ACOCZ5_01880 [bacterium]